LLLSDDHRTLLTYLPLPFALHPSLLIFFFFHDPATTEIYTLSLHDALPISPAPRPGPDPPPPRAAPRAPPDAPPRPGPAGRFTRSEEHTSELQSRGHLVCRLLLEKKKKNQS